MIFKFLKSNYWVILILAVGLFLRLYKPLDFYIYNHDGDLASWIVKDVVVNHHFRLIGQETSVHGVFIGPLFYYLLIPFYLLGRMDPFGGVFLSALIGIFTIFSFYWVFTKIFNRKVGFVSAIIYSLSFYTVLTDRDVVPTTPAMLWSVWFLYCTHLLYKGEQKKGFILSAIMISLIWHINLALLLLTPLLLVSLVLGKVKINLKILLLGAIVLIITSSPFLLFETRHNFQQTKAIIASVTTNRNYIPGTSTGINKFERVITLSSKNISGLLWGDLTNVSHMVAFYLLIGIFVFLVIKKVLPVHLAIIFFCWQALYFIFFTINSLNLSEYYLNGMNVIWIEILAIFFVYLLNNKKLKILGLVLVLGFAYWNLYRFFIYKPNQIGYRQKKELVHYIKVDAEKHGYPCVAVSYITSPGYDLGYRYFFWLENMHVNQSWSRSPVYSIVFPLAKVSRIDKSFGVLGLVLPDYERYSQDKVKISCSGQNSNLTDPLFGYTE